MIEKIVKLLSKNIFLVLIVVISFLYLIPILQPGFFIGHDNTPQVARIAARIQAIQDGQFPPRWAGELNYGYGIPGFIFFYSLSGYLGSFLYFLGFSLENSYELLMVLTFTLSPFFFYLWTNQFLKNKYAFVSSLFYGLAPYSFLDTFVRAHLGESLALALIPMTLYFIEKNLKKPSINFVIFGGITQALLILSHSILSFMFTFIFFGYILVKSYHNVKTFITSIGILTTGLLLTIYFWLPALYEGKYINSKVFLSDWYKDHFISFSNIIYSKWGFGSNINDPGGLSAQIGPIHAVLVLVSFYFIFKKSKDRLIMFFWIIIFVIAVFMSTSSSGFIWSKLHILQQFQFPWRFTALSSFSAAVLTGYALQKLNSKKVLTLSLIGLLILGIPMSKIWKNETRGDKYYFKYPGTTAYHNEATTIWVAGDAYEYPKRKVEIISGKGNVEKYTRKSNLHTFYINAATDISILDNTVYFPGWRAEVDGKKTTIEFQDQNHRGLITFKVPQGEHKVEVKFGESPVRLISDMISLFGILTVVFLLVSKKWIKRYLKI
ncbi:MAG: hypothetical protein ACD_37C00141G0001 [uncultured bacterium]|nr:MAG: hypothetical protein ACD_37C00141G0001 [uncultured bacterium]